MDRSNKRVVMLPAKRRAMILDHLRSQGPTSIGELAATLGGSQSTVRRDLEHLVEGGYLERTHGGAVLISNDRATFEREPAINAQMRHAQKEAIGRAAASLLRSGDSVVFDGSSTVLEAVHASASSGVALTAITNALDTAAACSDVPGWRVIVPGGTVRAGTRLLVGDLSRSFFDTIHADLCFTGALAVTGTVLTDASLEVAEVKRAMLRSARRKVLLVDSSKFTVPAFCTFGDLSAFDGLITDDGVDPEILSELRGSRLEVMVAKTEQPASHPGARFRGTDAVVA